MGTSKGSTTRLLGSAVGPGSAGAIVAHRIYSPWDHAGTDYPEWVIRRRDLRGPRELLCWRRRVILLDQAQTVTQTRCSLAHALGHLDLEHAVGQTTAKFERREEAAAEQLASRRLLPIDRLTDALVYTASISEASDHLWVDVDMLRTRLDHLHPSETAAIRRAFAARDNTENGMT